MATTARSTPVPTQTNTRNSSTAVAPSTRRLQHLKRDLNVQGTSLDYFFFFLGGGGGSWGGGG